MAPLVTSGLGTSNTLSETTSSMSGFGVPAGIIGALLKYNTSNLLNFFLSMVGSIFGVSLGVVVSRRIIRRRWRLRSWSTKPKV